MSTTATDEWMGSITIYEAAQIWNRFHRDCPRNQQVLWSGVSYPMAQEWARERGKQTLSIAMGVLMDSNDANSRLRIKTSPKQRTNYIHSASIIFSISITTGTDVVLLTPPPPERFLQVGRSYYQRVEEPWIKACCGNKAFQIRMVHPDVHGAESFSYQYWPTDQKSEWEAHFAGFKRSKKHRQDVFRKEACRSVNDYYTDLLSQRNLLIERMEMYATGRPVYWPTISGCAPCAGTVFMGVATPMNQTRGKIKTRKADSAKPPTALCKAKSRLTLSQNSQQHAKGKGKVSDSKVNVQPKGSCKRPPTVSSSRKKKGEKNKEKDKSEKQGLQEPKVGKQVKQQVKQQLKGPKKTVMDTAVKNAEKKAKKRAKKDTKSMGKKMASVKGNLQASRTESHVTAPKLNCKKLK